MYFNVTNNLMLSKLVIVNSMGDKENFIINDEEIVEGRGELLA
jgi:hypothetical protein